MHIWNWKQCLRVACTAQTKTSTILDEFEYAWNGFAEIFGMCTRIFGHPSHATDDISSEWLKPISQQFDAETPVTRVYHSNEFAWIAFVWPPLKIHLTLYESDINCSGWTCVSHTHRTISFLPTFRIGQCCRRCTVQSILRFECQQHVKLWPSIECGTKVIGSFFQRIIPKTGIPNGISLNCDFLRNTTNAVSDNQVL